MKAQDMPESVQSAHNQTDNEISTRPEFGNSL
jgi:hypothetical protein